MLALLSVVNGAVSAVSVPASSAMLPQTVPVAELRAANALSRMFVNTGMIAGAALGGMLSAMVDPGAGLACNALGLAVVALDALPLLALAQSADVVLLMAAMFVNGIAIEQFSVAWDLSLQENIPQDRLARVYAYDALGSTIALPGGEMAAGPFAEQLTADSPEEYLLLATALGDELRRRAAARAPGTTGAMTDAELWLDPDAWHDIQESARDLGKQVHAAARPPETPDAVRVSATVVLFEMNRPGQQES